MHILRMTMLFALMRRNRNRKAASRLSLKGAYTDGPAPTRRAEQRKCNCGETSGFLTTDPKAFDGLGKYSDAGFSRHF